MFEDSDDDEPRIKTPESLPEKPSRFQFDFSYLGTTSGKCKIVELVLAIAIICNVATAAYRAEYYAILFLTNSCIAALTSFGIMAFYVLKVIEKYDYIDWNKHELLFDTAMAIITTAGVFTFIYAMFYEERVIKKIGALGAILVIMYVYDASLKFVTDDLNVDDPMRLIEEEKEERNINSQKKKRWAD